jgi:nitrogen fixation protein FixH
MTGKSFTGYHMTIILVAFFGVIIAVNFYMARVALGTFGGTVVNNSYVASQKYNKWLDQARAQLRLGWSVEATLTARRNILVRVESDKAVASLSVQGSARHPLLGLQQRTLHFASSGDGRLQSVEALPAGRWIVDLEIQGGDHPYRKRVEFQ